MGNIVDVKESPRGRPNSGSMGTTIGEDLRERQLKSVQRSGIRMRKYHEGPWGSFYLMNGGLGTKSQTKSLLGLIL